jgi:hypothetical protein
MRVCWKLPAAVSLFACALAYPVIAGPADLAADHLVSEQSKSGQNPGLWPNELEFSGSIDAGLISAFGLTGTPTYKAAAITATNAIQTYRSNSNGDPPIYLGDETYSMSRLSTLTGDNTYAGWANTFYDNTIRHSTLGTSGYISNFVGSNETSTAVIMLAYHTLASYAPNVNAIDKNLWRNATIQELGDVTNADLFPVQAAGAALWALASTGPLDNTLINPNAAPGSLWDGVKLSDLPGIVARQEVTTGAQAGTFNYQFDIANSTPFTEDTAYGTLGLMAAYRADLTLYPYQAMTIQSQQKLATGVDPNSFPSGAVYQILADPNSNHYNLYNGELLQALPEPASLGILLIGAGGLLRRNSRRRNAARCLANPH